MRGLRCWPFALLRQLFRHLGHERRIPQLGQRKLRQLRRQFAILQLIHPGARIERGVQLSERLDQAPCRTLGKARAVGQEDRLPVVTRKADSVFIRCLPVFHL